ncbi:hypothetical protein [Longispora albida]|uniref:hypothetical protein n=1 Tax=Longispora albida TaxID=203523 RepID=UPI0003602636|nr:hypothetical protein [Longispora albida]
MCPDCEHINEPEDDPCVVCHDRVPHPALTGPDGPDRTWIADHGPFWVEVVSGRAAVARRVAGEFLGQPGCPDQRIVLDELRQEDGAYRMRAEIHPFPSLGGAGGRRPLPLPLGGRAGTRLPGVVVLVNPELEFGVADLARARYDESVRQPGRLARLVALGELVPFSFAEAEGAPYFEGELVELDVVEAQPVRRGTNVTRRTVRRRL